MALVRITPDTAVETVQQQLATFVESVGAAGRSPALQKLAAAGDRLQELSRSGALEAELLALGGLHPAWTGVIAEWLGIEPGPLVEISQGESTVELPPDLSRAITLVRLRSDLEIRPRRAGERVPPILVVACGSNEQPTREVLNEVLTQIQSRPLSLLLAPKASEWPKALSGLGSRDTWVCKPLELEGLASAGMRLEETVTRPPWKQAGAFAAAWSVAGALASLYEAFSVALDKEDRATRAKKAAVEQRSQQLQGAASPQELLGEARGVLQKQFDRLLKKLGREMKELVTPKEGTLALEIEGTIETLAGFDVTKKPKIDVLTIPPAFEQPLLDRVREALGGSCRAGLVEIHDFLRDIKEKIERLIEERSGPPVTLHFQHLPADRIESILSRYVGIQRPYKGELTRRGPMDYFMAARRYQMLFFMIFSTFGLSFVRGYRAITVPIGILLMAFGMLNVINSTKKQRAELEDKELDKARDLLKNELNRAMAEVQKQWDQAVSAFLSEQQNAALETIEMATRSSSALGSREAAGDKELVSQQLKSLDATQRKLAEGVKKAEAASQDLEQIRGHLIEYYVAATSPPEAPPAPGAPGTPGAARPGAPGVATTPRVPGTPGGGGIPVAAPGGGAVPKPPQVPAATAAALEKLKQAQAGKAASVSPGIAKPTPPRPAAPAAPSGAAPAQPGAPAALDVEKLKREAQEKLKQAQAGKAAGVSAGTAKPTPPRPASPAAASGPAPAKPGAPAALDVEKLKREAQKKLEAAQAKARAAMPVKSPATPKKPSS